MANILDGGGSSSRTDRVVASASPTCTAPNVVKADDHLDHSHSPTDEPDLFELFDHGLMQIFMR